MNRFGAAGGRAFAGAAAIAVALATGELLAGLLPGVPSPLLAIAQLLIDFQPPFAKEIAVAIFGTADKLAFQVIIVAIALGVGAWLGRQAPRRPGLVAIVIALFAAAGFAASLRDPSANVALTAGAAGVEAIVGIALLRRLSAAAATTSHPDPRAGMPDWRRRSLLQTGGALAGGAVVAGVLGRYLLEARRTAPPPSGVGVPVAPDPADLPAGADLATADLTAAGLTPIVVPNDDFYRIDTALIVPTVDRATWSLRVHGLVEREVTLTYDELVALPLLEQYVTIACVSNEVGGDLIGNAKWTGVPLRDVLALAGVLQTADQLVGRSVDGFTAGMPVEWVMDPAREPMIAVAMNGEALPRDHGYPARLIIPGLYGYVSATKWLSELELTTFERFEGFWIPRGWAANAPVLTQSRIDVPRSGAKVSPGRVPVAGVAWAMDRGVRAVEVRIDDGAWAPARLSAAISKATWVQWLYDWDATPGDHVIAVRTIDGTGEVQTDQRSNPAPDGARGHHQVRVGVR